jgi:hypothetical protein
MVGGRVVLRVGRSVMRAFVLIRRSEWCLIFDRQ